VVFRGTSVAQRLFGVLGSAISDERLETLRNRLVLLVDRYRFSSVLVECVENIPRFIHHSSDNFTHGLNLSNEAHRLPSWKRQFIDLAGSSWSRKKTAETLKRYFLSSKVHFRDDRLASEICRGETFATGVFAR
jgi:hypothetical protein